MVNCSECKAEISDAAASCPKCGAPRAPKRKTSAFTWIMAVFIGLWLIGYLASFSHQVRTDAAAAGPSPKQVVADKLSLDFEWRRGGFDAILLLSPAKVTNKSDRDIKDFTVKCSGAGSSGTRIDSNEKTFYEVVKKGETKKFAELNMGFLNSQVQSLGCKITDFVLL